MCVMEQNSSFTTQAVLQKFRSLFVFRDDGCIRHIGTTWIWEQRKITDELLLAHLQRKQVIGLCPVKDGKLIWSAIDFDVHGEGTKESLQPDVLATLDNLSRLGIQGHLEDSGRGYHIWVFVEEPVSAEEMKRVLSPVLSGKHAIYAGGNSIRLPLGVYPTDRRIFCCFLKRDFTPYQNQRDYLLNHIHPTPLAEFERVVKLNET